MTRVTVTRVTVTLTAVVTLLKTLLVLVTWLSTSFPHAGG